MPIDVIQNANSATVTSGGTTAPAALTSEGWTVTTAANWTTFTSSLTGVVRVIDILDIGKTTGYEIMEVTTIANGTGVSWTVTRGVEGTTPYAHAASWTVIPAPSAGAFDGRYAPLAAANVAMSCTFR